MNDAGTEGIRIFLEIFLRITEACEHRLGYQK